MEQNAILCKNLRKEYQVAGKTTEVLSIEELAIKKGTFFGILGHNGAGKSTLINIISSIIEKTAGNVEIFGQNIEKNPQFAKNKIGTAIQEIQLDPFLTVTETLDFQAGYYGISKKERKIEELLHNLGLYEHRNKRSRMLSGGMQRRLVIAKALVHNPEIIILDEPTAGVDIELRANLWSFINTLKNSGKTIIITTHYLEEAQELCDEIAFIKGGKIILNDKKTNILSLMDKKTLIVKSKSEILPQIEGVTINLHSIGFEIIYAPSVIKTIDLIDKLKTQIEIQDLTIKDATLDAIFSYIINR
jgi:ABC-2 type transport system ATP-binding protein